ncbi:hypothetical protein AAY473_032848, partial [Plecturocebus cupreus]
MWRETLWSRPRGSPSKGYDIFIGVLFTLNNYEYFTLQLLIITSIYEFNYFRTSKLCHQYRHGCSWLILPVSGSPKSTGIHSCNLGSWSEGPLSLGQSSGSGGNKLCSIRIVGNADCLELECAGVSLCHPGRGVVARSQLTVTSAFWVQMILLFQPPEWLGLQA